MKKLLSVVAATFAIAAIAAEPSPIIGVTKVTTTNKNTIVAVPFKAITNSTANISVKDLVCTNGIPANTWIYVFGGASYTAWKLGTEGWVPAVSASETEIIAAAKADASQTVASPGAIWIVLPDAPAESQDIYLYGNFDVAPTSSPLANGSNLIANPLQTNATISVSPIAGDEILIPNYSNGYDRYSYRVSRTSGEGFWRLNNKTVSLPTISVGQGLWYVTTNSAPGSVSWVTP